MAYLEVASPKPHQISLFFPENIFLPGLVSLYFFLSFCYLLFSLIKVFSFIWWLSVKFCCRWCEPGVLRPPQYSHSSQRSSLSMSIWFNFLRKEHFFSFNFFEVYVVYHSSCLWWTWFRTGTRVTNAKFELSSLFSNLYICVVTSSFWF